MLRNMLYQKFYEHKKYNRIMENFLMGSASILKSLNLISYLV